MNDANHIEKDRPSDADWAKTVGKRSRGGARGRGGRGRGSSPTFQILPPIAHVQSLLSQRNALLETSVAPSLHSAEATTILRPVSHTHVESWLRKERTAAVWAEVVREERRSVVLILSVVSWLGI